MIYLFKVSDLNFIQYDSDKDILRFTPANSIEKASKNIELIKRIFEEDIIVNPDAPTPTYSEVIQTLIDADAQTVEDVAEILDLYNPADIPEILQKLITANADTREKIVQNSNVLAYPYEQHSAIYDYKYVNWTAYGDLTPRRLSENGGYHITECALQRTSLFPSSQAEIKIELTFMPFIGINQGIFFLYTSLNTETVNKPYYRLIFSYDDRQYQVKKRATDNGTIQIGESDFSANNFSYGETVDLVFWKYKNGTMELRKSDGSILSLLESTSSFIPRSILIGSSGVTTKPSENLDANFLKFKISVNDTVVSQWHK